ncbi:Pro-kumamolisin, activation domain [Actinacidiphila yanglinensis]|uniref:Pro-kumamolisin, activation domain n=1 Tax=Actinacidiphila yanglinensis TaxID=310779 RepID=A0A1H6DZ70_9ACTN|nr:protease pro-enzyme activation domain-containing protein [Actinacidiphila yanglinensis]SEG90632.1 Pro-kumamolisin, activation domain [Actinacidiphila yanglinensis]
MVACLAAGAAGVLLGPPATARAAATVTVPGSVSPAVAAASRVGDAPAAQAMTVQVWLAPDLAGAAAYADAVATPGGARHRHYLTPRAYTARFGPSAARAEAVASWLTAKGLTGVRVDGGRDYVSATGPVSAVQSAFRVRIAQYRANGPAGGAAPFEANDRDVSVPAALAPDVLGVTGLGDATGGTARPAAAPLVRGTVAGPAASTAGPATCARYWGEHTHGFTPAYRGLTQASLPVCGYSAAQMRAAYGATWALTGRGQTVALTESEAPTAMFATLTAYARANHLPLPRRSQFRQIQAGKDCAASASAKDAAASPAVADGPAVNDEAEMDSEAVYAMAPGADQVMVVGRGCDEDQALLDAALAVLTGDGDRPRASIVSNSWQIPLGEVPAGTVHAIDVRAAAEGVGMYVASGDTSGLTATDADPYAVAVGGTTLGVGAAGNRVFETGWSDDYGSLDGGKWTDLGISGGGGGTSLTYRQPSYQKGVVPASMARARVGKRTVLDRAVPDIAADADPDTGLLTGYTDPGSGSGPGTYRTLPNAGTSLACPLVAALVADAQQGRGRPFGFVDPLLYRLAGTPALHDVLPVGRSAPQRDRGAWLAADGSGTGAGVDVFDAQDRGQTQQVTAKGYDTMTGVGTPNGAAFLTALRRAPR